MEAAPPPGPLHGSDVRGVYEKCYLVAQQPGTKLRTEYQSLECHFGFASPISTQTARAIAVPSTFPVPGGFCPSRSKVYFGSGFKLRWTKTEEILLA